jgi:anti-sigma factor RsiW
MSRSIHVEDNELLRSVDGELSSSRSAEIRAHLSVCAFCRRRRSELESIAAEVARVNRDSLDAQLPAASASRAALRSRMAQASRSDSGRVSWRAVLQAPHVMQTAAVVAGMFLLTVATARLMNRPIAGTFPAGAPIESEGNAIPNGALTPGAVRNVTLAEVCAMPHEEVELDVPAPLRAAVLQEYGIANARPSDYEIDYLIAPGLGGSEDIHNLWPEPFRSSAWNAHVKDSLEEYLHHQVCAGNLDLRTAQTDIRTNWIAAYKKYFHTDEPVAGLPEPATTVRFEFAVPAAPLLSVRL